LPRPIIKSYPEKKVGWPWARELPEIGGFLYNIYTMAGASDFKYGT